jgi:outer membrane receptor protein involved in Fe transport
MQNIGKYLLTSAMAVVAIVGASPASAAPREKKEYHLPEQDLGSALRAIGRTSRREIMFRVESVRGKRAPALNGSYTADEAVEILLRDTQLTATLQNGSILIRERFPETTKQLSVEDREIVVTGSRIRGGIATSPTITISSDEITSSGYSNLGEVVRALPQSFNGGQNPGIGIGVPVASGENLGSGSSINLRGIGQDATLTLLNGHRLANGGNRQSIDVSAIPVDAIQRIEIVPDGASAIYGSDAVAGVANVILKPDYQGVTTTARWGLATDGGNRQQQYSSVAGKRWASGGLIAAYDFGRDTAIVASQRSYTAKTNPGLTLYPFIKHHSAVLNIHQTLTDEVKFSADAGYNWRADQRGYAVGTAVGSPAYDVTVKSSSFFLAPSLRSPLWQGWSVLVSGMYGRDHARLRQQLIYNGSTSTTLVSCACNSAISVEIKADGSLIDLPGGVAKLAVGGGYRRDTFRQEMAFTRNPSNFSSSQADGYGFAELNVPLVGRSQSVPAVRSLAFSAAGRYDSYPGIAEVITPKLGLAYSPTDDVAFRVSWGKSFKVPTLFQRYSTPSAGIYGTTILGGTGFPAGSTAILLVGGRPDLSPERARTWTATASFHPTRLPGLRVEATYFDISYRDRVIMPIPLLQQSLSNSVYASFVTLTPSAATIAAALAGKPVSNNSGVTFNPNSVVAIVDDRNINVATQKLRGVDLSAEYTHKMSNGDRLSLIATGSYLDSKQKLLPAADTIDLAGTYYNPPHLRVRTGISWDSRRGSLSGFVNYIGGVRDIRFIPANHVSAMATLDLAGRLRFQDRVLHDSELFISAQNVTNAGPDITRSRAAFDAPYDTTNYSPVGRLLSLGFRKTW